MGSGQEVMGTPDTVEVEKNPPKIPSSFKEETY